MAKIKKARKPSQRDKEIKAKRTGYRFKTEGNPKLHKQDGSLNKKGEELYYKKPTTDEIEKYKKTNNKYPDADGLRQIYHERRANRKHSDDNLTKKYDKGGRVYKEGLAYKLERAKHNKSEDWEVPMSKRKKKFDNGGGIEDVLITIESGNDGELKEVWRGKNTIKNQPIYNSVYKNQIKKGKTVFLYENGVLMYSDFADLDEGKYEKGGGVKQNKAQSESYSKKADKLEKAKPVGMRYTDKLAKKLGKRVREEPTKKDVEKYLGKGVYDEKRKDKSDISISNKFEEGGETEPNIELSLDEMKASLGREPKYPYDFIKGKKYVKCFLRPYYKLVD